MDMKHSRPRVLCSDCKYVLDGFDFEMMAPRCRRKASKYVILGHCQRSEAEATIILTDKELPYGSSPPLPLNDAIEAVLRTVVLSTKKSRG
jgi:hypothetical protein